MFLFTRIKIERPLLHPITMKSTRNKFKTTLALAGGLVLLHSCEKPIEEAGTLYTIEGEFFYDCAQTQPAANRSGTLRYSKGGGMKAKHYTYSISTDANGKLSFGYYSYPYSRTLALDGSDPNTVNLYGFVMNVPHAQNINLGKVTLNPDFKFYVKLKIENNYSNLDTLFLNDPQNIMKPLPVPGPFIDTLIGPFIKNGSVVDIHYRNGKFGYKTSAYGRLRLNGNGPEQDILIDSPTDFMCNCEDSIVETLVIK